MPVGQLHKWDIACVFIVSVALAVSIALALIGFLCLLCLLLLLLLISSFFFYFFNHFIRWQYLIQSVCLCYSMALGWISVAIPMDFWTTQKPEYHKHRIIASPPCSVLHALLIPAPTLNLTPTTNQAMNSTSDFNGETVQ
jgi:hypothetical protein